MRNKLFIKLIKGYQTNVSPNTKRACRYEPSCSQYSLEAYERYNFFKASYLSIKRITSCNPVGGYGYDPVPDKKTKKEEIR